MRNTFISALLILVLAGSCLAMGQPPAKEGENMGSNPKVIMETSKGTLVVELYPDKAPETVKNFLSYVDSGFYDGTIFHRVIPNFMIQGGGFTKGMTEKLAGMPVKNEAGNGLSNKRGTIAMARTAVVDSATAQFFINTVDNPFLDHRDDTQAGYGYCVFGKVVEGMENVDAIKMVQTHSSGYYEDVPVEEVVILSTRRM